MTTTLINDDCMKYLKTIQKNSINLVLTDIPYDYVNSKSHGMKRSFDKGKADTITFDLLEFIELITYVCNGSFYIFCGPTQFSTIFDAFKKKDIISRTCLLEKTNPAPVNGDQVWLSGVELCVYGKKRNSTFNYHCKNTVWRYPVSRNKLHPTQKPLGLFEYLILASTKENDIVLDPCMGSNTTGLACINTKRNFIGIELDQKYYKICTERIDKHKISVQNN